MDPECKRPTRSSRLPVPDIAEGTRYTANDPGWRSVVQPVTERKGERRHWISDKAGERIVARSSLIGFVEARRLMLPITFVDLALSLSLSPSINRKNFHRHVTRTALTGFSLSFFLPLYHSSTTTSSSSSSSPSFSVFFYITVSLSLDGSPSPWLPWESVSFRSRQGS